MLESQGFVFHGEATFGTKDFFLGKNGELKTPTIFTVRKTRKIFFFTVKEKSKNKSYMIISLWDHPENIGSSKGDLDISFITKDGTWTEEINMGETINMRCGENCPMVSPDGKYFFFNRHCEDTDKGDMYWVDGNIIETYRPKEIM